MSLELLHQALKTMRPTGVEGFEGLSATLLGALTGYQFYVARSGDQPADAVSVPGGIAIQGKRYDKTPLDETEFEGDFSKACRVCPDLDCYVVATTRPTAQLEILAHELENITAVDVLLLGFEKTTDSALLALCVTFWQCIQHYPHLSLLGVSFGEWAATQSRRPEIQSRIDRLRDTLTTSVPLANTIAEKLRVYLEGRFGIAPTSTRAVRFPIDLTHAVRRDRPEEELQRWWKSAHHRSAVVIGEEGMGKSTVAATFSYGLSKHSAQLVVWLDSADWSGAPNLEAVLDIAWTLVGFTNMQLRQRLTRKAVSRWSERLLLVLDGVNERDARETAHRLLARLQAPDQRPCRLIFTTRPIGARSDERSLWQAAAKILVERFTEPELHRAVAGLAPPISRNELPDGLLEVAKVPRYFLRAVHLRNRFHSFDNVSKEMVLWADLLAKINEGDEQVRNRIGWDSAAAAKRALRRLAQAARAIKSDIRADGLTLLEKSFGSRFEEIRSDLAEQRIVLEPHSDNPRPSPAHVVLGFALHLAEVVSSAANETIAESADRLSKELEPVMSNDDLTEALFVALQLSTLPDGEGLTLSSHARSACLLAWTASQNSQLSEKRLEFWATWDSVAYLDFVEEIFVEPVSETWADLVNAPLKNMWRRASTELMTLDSRLRRWLKLMWKSHDLPTTGELDYLGEKIPIARSRGQLTLSHAALAILAERPIESFAVDLAITSASNRLSTDRHFWPKSSQNEPEQSQDISCKEVNYNLRPVLRWRFTEHIKPALSALRANSNSTECVRAGAEDLMREFDEFGWRWGGTEVQYLRDGNPLFPVDDENRKNRFCTCPELAVRTDIPELSASDQAVIREKVEAAFASEALRAGLYHTQADSDLDDHLSWYARSIPQGLREWGSRFRFAALVRADPGRGLDLANHLPYDPRIVSPLELLVVAKEFIERGLANPPSQFDWTVTKLHVLAFTCFEEAELKEWLIFASVHKAIRLGIHYYPVPVLCPLLVGPDLAKFARDQARRCWDEPVDLSDRTEAEFDFWGLIGSLAGPPDVEYHDWLDDKIRNEHLAGHRQFYCSALWFRTATNGALKSAIADGSIIRQLTDDGLRPLIWAQSVIDDWDRLQISFESLSESLAIDDIGTLLLLAGRDSDINKWGHYIFNRAISLVGNPSFERRFWGRTIYTRDELGRIHVSNCDREDESASKTLDSLRPVSSAVRAALHTTATIQEMNRKANEAIRIWHGDLEKLDKIEKGAFSRFSAFRALVSWRDNNRVDFEAYASEFLDRVLLRPADGFHLGGFVAAVIDAFVSVNPQRAFAADNALSDSSLRVRVINEYGQSTFDAILWREAGKGNKQCSDLCERLLQSCATDQGLMSYAIVAQAERVGATLFAMCNDLLARPLARDRALAVSLLAWIADETAIALLGQLISTDASGWIREHAKWAREVAEQERGVRKFYEDILQHLDDANDVLTRLQVMFPALTPTSRWWHRNAEENASTLSAAPNRSKAALSTFWHDVNSHSNGRSKIFGRDLREYLRGDRIGDLRTPKPRLLGD